MKKVKSLVTPLTFCLLFLFALQASAQQTFRTTKPSVIGYLEYLPKDYASNSNKYPVVIFLHGIGERGANSTNPATLETSIASITKLGPPKHAKAGADFPFIMISPQLKNNYGNWPLSYIMEVINHAKTYLRIDEKRIHITGLSLGGGGAWSIAQDSPQLFASLSPICGGYNSTAKAPNIAKENIPVWAFHGDADPTVGLSKSVNMVNAINNSSPTPNPRALMTIYPGVKHNAWDKAYDPSHSYHNPNVYEWMMKFTNTVNKGNKIPTANAGSDINQTGKTLTIKGSGSDPDGSITAYKWTKISGPSATISGATSANLSLTNLASGTFMFRLQVTDNIGNTDSDYVKVTIASGSSSGSGNISPVASAGSDKSLTLPVNTISLFASAVDSDGKIVSYAWSKVSGGSASLSGATSSKLNLSGLVAGTYVFRVTVKDDKGASDSDDMKLTVNAGSSSGNVAPVANAGANQSLGLPVNTISLYGSGKDSDGKITSYSWSKVSGGAANLTTPTAAKLNVTGMVAGTYVFRLTVKDDKGASDADDVMVTVRAATSSNVAPVANAGADKTLSLPINTVSLYGSGKDSDGKIVSYAWRKVSGGAANLTTPTSAKLNVTGMVAGTYVFRLTVKDDKGATGYNDVKVTVHPPKSTASVNRAPVSNAGKDINTTSSVATVNGSGTDYDGNIVSYTWKQLQGASVKLSGIASRKLSVSGLKTGWYVFQLMVKDNKGATDTDKMGIRVR